MVECYSDAQAGTPQLFTLGTHDAPDGYAQDTEGTGGTNIPNDITQTGSGAIG